MATRELITPVDLLPELVKGDVGFWSSTQTFDGGGKPRDSDTD